MVFLMNFLMPQETFIDTESDKYKQKSSDRSTGLWLSLWSCLHVYMTRVFITWELLCQGPTGTTDIGQHDIEYYTRNIQQVVCR